MADAAEKQVDPQDTDASDESSSKPKKAMLPIATVALVVINLGLLGGMGFMLNKMLSQINELQQTPVVTQEDLQDLEEQTVLGKEMEPRDLGVLYPLDGFLVNLSTDEGPKFLQLKMELELADGGVEEELSRKKAAVRDAIIVHLSAQSYRELRRPNGIKKLREDLLTVIRNIITTGSVNDIYFTTFHFN